MTELDTYAIPDCGGGPSDTEGGLSSGGDAGSGPAPPPERFTSTAARCGP